MLIHMIAHSYEYVNIPRNLFSGNSAPRYRDVRGAKKDSGSREGTSLVQGVRGLKKPPGGWHKKTGTGVGRPRE